MANRRMISKSVIDSDAFLDMPQTTQNLYFHLNIRADDDGFLDNPKKVMRTIGANQNDLEVLLAKRYILAFDSGVIVIKHWRLHNTLRKDRYKPTLYKEELNSLSIKDNGIYTDSVNLLPDNNIETVTTDWQPDGNQTAPSGCPSIGEVSIDKSSIKEKKQEKKENLVSGFEPYIPKTQPPKQKQTKNLYDSMVNHWNSKGNLVKALSSLNNPEALSLCNIISEYGEDYVKQAIDNLSENIMGIESKYRPGSLTKFLKNSVGYWAELKNEEQESTNKVSATAPVYEQIAPEDMATEEDMEAIKGMFKRGGHNARD